MEANQQAWLCSAPSYYWASLDYFSRGKKQHVLCVRDLDGSIVDAIHPCNLLFQATIRADVRIVGQGEEHSGYAYRQTPRTAEAVTAALALAER